MSDGPRRLRVVPLEPEPGPQALVDEILGLLRQLRDVHDALQRHPDPGGPLEATMLALSRRRDALAQRLGTEALRCLASGGTVRILPAPRRPRRRVRARAAG